MSYEPNDQEPTNPEFPTPDASTSDTPGTSDPDDVFGGLPTGDIPADDFVGASDPVGGPTAGTAEDGAASFEESGGGTATMAPPPPPPAAAPRRLVRDPYSRLGGVASGLGHHYGIDVSVVRIIFVLAALASGIGLLVYLLAWLVIPRADYWPPAGQPRPLRSLSGRDLGLGLAVVGLMVALGFGAAGATGSILIPLVLVGGGVWLMVQPPSVNQTSGTSETMAGYSAGGVGTPPPPAPGFNGPAGAPVPPRSRKRRFGVVAVVIGVVMALVIVPLMIAVAFFAAVANGEFEFSSIGDDPIVFTPATVDAIPNRIIEDGAELEIDLTRLDAADFRNIDEPVEINADVDFGKITVIVPDDIDVSVDASTGLGDVTVFGDTEDGFSPSIVDRNSDPDIELILDMDIGEVVVING